MDDITAVRILIGDQNSAEFQDSEVAMFNTLAGVDGPGSEYYLAAALAINALASLKASNLVEQRIGDFSDSSGRNQIKGLQDTAQRYTDLYYNTPAFGIAETDESDLNALIIIRNFVLRNTPSA